MFLVFQVLFSIIPWRRPLDWSRNEVYCLWLKQLEGWIWPLLIRPKFIFYRDTNLISSQIIKGEVSAFVIWVPINWLKVCDRNLQGTSMPATLHPIGKDSWSKYLFRKVQMQLKYSLFCTIPMIITNKAHLQEISMSCLPLC